MIKERYSKKKITICILFIISGMIGIISAIIAGPGFISKYFVSDHQLEAEGIELLQRYRQVSFLAGFVLIAIGILFLKVPDKLFIFYRGNLSCSMKLAISVLIIVCLLSFSMGFIHAKSRVAAFVENEDLIWAIGIYTGDSPFSMMPPVDIDNPVLTANDVTDIEADFVADPFMVNEGNSWYMFFEVLNSETKHGDVGLATSSDGLNWTYKQIVLDEPFHISYPYTFKWNDIYYMIPETADSQELRLYKAVKFPEKWQLVKILMKGDFIDPSIVHFNNKWWLFAETNPKGHDRLSLYYAEDLFGPWKEHPGSPLITDNANISRPGGRVIVYQGNVIRFPQDDYPVYGNQLRAFEITDMTTETYRERNAVGKPILEATGAGWNEKGMHHIDVHQLDNGKWIASVDGHRASEKYGCKSIGLKQYFFNLLNKMKLYI